MIRKPNFFIVGFPKSGTSAVHIMIEQHPEIVFAVPGEPRYSCADLLEESRTLKPSLWEDPMEAARPFFTTSEEDYLRCFRHAGNEKIVAEASVYYLFSRVAAEKIKAYSPDAKILIMIREPTEFLYSWHSALVSEIFSGPISIYSMRPAKVSPD